MSAIKGKVLALSGGVGGAKLVRGLAEILEPEQLLVVANTGDDFVHLGLRICPDLDSVMYAMADLNDEQRGWGLADESWQAMDALGRLGGETWFSLGDRDLATHLLRSQMLAQGKNLSEVTQILCERLGVHHRLLPMSDNTVSTMVNTGSGELGFQEYFVREQCQPEVTGFRFAGINRARPAPDFVEWLQSPDLAAVVICPSNPFVSVAPILSIRGVRTALFNCAAPIVAISPIIGGSAVKGPAAKMMRELDMSCSAPAVAAWYGDLLDGFVIDEVDRALADSINVSVQVVPTLMTTLDSKKQLAADVLDFALKLN